MKWPDICVGGRVNNAFLVGMLLISALVGTVMDSLRISTADGAVAQSPVGFEGVLVASFA